jgi:hypothetical protein
LTSREKINPDITLSKYHAIANRSLDELDELLTHQGNRNPPPSGTYTTSTFARGSVPD